MIRTIYHGSDHIIQKPVLGGGKPYNDYGYGFYCTNMEKQARKWAITKKGDSVVSVYHYHHDSTLRICSFPVMTEEWLDFVINCRQGVPHDFDIVEGPMADDQIWDYVEDLIDGTITREAFWVLVKFKYPTHQIVFCTTEALSAITYERSYEV
jgi:hypothetical protein